MGDFFTILITGGIIATVVVVAINFVIKTIIVNNRSVLDSTLTLLVGALTAAKYVVIWGYISALIGIIPFLSFFSYITLIIAFYHFIHAFPLAFGWVFAFIAGMLSEEILVHLPEFMLNYYNKNTLINFYPIIAYKNGESDERPDVFLTKGAWDDPIFMKEVNKYFQGKRDSIPYRNEYDLMAESERNQNENTNNYQQTNNTKNSVDVEGNKTKAQSNEKEDVSEVLSEQEATGEYDYSELEKVEIRAVESGLTLGTIQAVIFCFNDEEITKIAKSLIKKYRVTIENNISLRENQINDLLEVENQLSNLVDEYLMSQETYVDEMGEEDFQRFNEQINNFYTGFNLIIKGAEVNNSKISSTGFKFIDDYEAQFKKIIEEKDK
ncbi:hypothetical protein QOK74_08595 [Staphylococcus saprophyticus]|uniref:hypothetical protein n=1 Tax=Staphylococcus saprophyticus TaxID=29385 RepID=UPI0024C45B76|nr:hypothetical protein [Staphylococcus saprophyticus]MDK1672931.1 hypothetical protein [Staphylococcus saprophyticus]